MDREEGKYAIRLYLMMTLWKWISVIFYNNLMIIPPLRKMQLSSVTKFVRINSQRDNILIIFLPNLRRSVWNVSFRICKARLSEKYDRNWYRKQSFKATPTPWTRFDIILYLTFDNISHKILKSIKLIIYEKLIDSETEIQNLKPWWSENFVLGNLVRVVVQHRIKIA